MPWPVAVLSKSVSSSTISKTVSIRHLKRKRNQLSCWQIKSTAFTPTTQQNILFLKKNPPHYARLYPSVKIPKKYLPNLCTDLDRASCRLALGHKNRALSLVSYGKHCTWIFMLINYTYNPLSRIPFTIFWALLKKKRPPPKTQYLSTGSLFTEYSFTQEISGGPFFTCHILK